MSETSNRIGTKSAGETDTRNIVSQHGGSNNENESKKRKIDETQLFGHPTESPLLKRSTTGAFHSDEQQLAGICREYFLNESGTKDKESAMEGSVGHRSGTQHTTSSTANSTANHNSTNSNTHGEKTAFENKFSGLHATSKLHNSYLRYMSAVEKKCRHKQTATTHSITAAATATSVTSTNTTTNPNNTGSDQVGYLHNNTPILNNMATTTPHLTPLSTFHTPLTDGANWHQQYATYAPHAPNVPHVPPPPLQSAFHQPSNTYPTLNTSSAGVYATGGNTALNTSNYNGTTSTYIHAPPQQQHCYLFPPTLSNTRNLTPPPTRLNLNANEVKYIYSAVVKFNRNSSTSVSKLYVILAELLKIEHMLPYTCAGERLRAWWEYMCITNRSSSVFILPKEDITNATLSSSSTTSKPVPTLPPPPPPTMSPLDICAKSISYISQRVLTYNSVLCRPFDAATLYRSIAAHIKVETDLLSVWWEYMCSMNPNSSVFLMPVYDGEPTSDANSNTQPPTNTITALQFSLSAEKVWYVYQRLLKFNGRENRSYDVTTLYTSIAAYLGVDCEQFRKWWECMCVSSDGSSVHILPVDRQVTSTRGAENTPGTSSVTNNTTLCCGEGSNTTFPLSLHDTMYVSKQIQCNNRALLYDVYIVYVSVADNLGIDAVELCRWWEHMCDKCTRSALYIRPVVKSMGAGGVVSANKNNFNSGVFYRTKIYHSVVQELVEVVRTYRSSDMLYSALQCSKPLIRAVYVEQLARNLGRIYSVFSVVVVPTKTLHAVARVASNQDSGSNSGQYSDVCRVMYDMLQTVELSSIVSSAFIPQSRNTDFDNSTTAVANNSDVNVDYDVNTAPSTTTQQTQQCTSNASVDALPTLGMLSSQPLLSALPTQPLLTSHLPSLVPDTNMAVAATTKKRSRSTKPRLSTTEFATGTDCVTSCVVDVDTAVTTLPTHSMLTTQQSLVALPSEPFRTSHLASPPTNTTTNTNTNTTTNNTTNITTNTTTDTGTASTNMKKAEPKKMSLQNIALIYDTVTQLREIFRRSKCAASVYASLRSKTHLTSFYNEHLKNSVFSVYDVLSQKQINVAKLRSIRVAQNPDCDKATNIAVSKCMYHVLQTVELHVSVLTIPPATTAAASATSVVPVKCMTPAYTPVNYKPLGDDVAPCTREAIEYTVTTLFDIWRLQKHSMSLYSTLRACDKNIKFFYYKYIANCSMRIYNIMSAKQVQKPQLLRFHIMENNVEQSADSVNVRVSRCMYDMLRTVELSVSVAGALDKPDDYIVGGSINEPEVDINTSHMRVTKRKNGPRSKFTAAEDFAILCFHDTDSSVTDICADPAKYAILCILSSRIGKLVPDILQRYDQLVQQTRSYAKLNTLSTLYLHLSNKTVHAARIKNSSDVHPREVVTVLNSIVSAVTYKTRNTEPTRLKAAPSHTNTTLTTLTPVGTMVYQMQGTAIATDNVIPPDITASLCHQYTTAIDTTITNITSEAAIDNPNVCTTTTAGVMSLPSDIPTMSSTSFSIYSNSINGPFGTVGSSGIVSTDTTLPSINTVGPIVYTDTTFTAAEDAQITQFAQGMITKPQMCHWKRLTRRMHKAPGACKARWRELVDSERRASAAGASGGIVSGSGVSAGTSGSGGGGGGGGGGSGGSGVGSGAGSDVGSGAGGAGSIAGGLGGKESKMVAGSIAEDDSGSNMVCYRSDAVRGHSSNKAPASFTLNVPRQVLDFLHPPVSTIRTSTPPTCTKVVPGVDSFSTSQEFTILRAMGVNNDNITPPTMSIEQLAVLLNVPVRQMHARCKQFVHEKYTNCFIPSLCSLYHFVGQADVTKVNSVTHSSVNEVEHTLQSIVRTVEVSHNQVTDTDKNHNVRRKYTAAHYTNFLAAIHSCTDGPSAGMWYSISNKFNRTAAGIIGRFYNGGAKQAGICVECCGRPCLYTAYCQYYNTADNTKTSTNTGSNTTTDVPANVATTSRTGQEQVTLTLRAIVHAVELLTPSADDVDKCVPIDHTQARWDLAHPRCSDGGHTNTCTQSVDIEKSLPVPVVFSPVTQVAAVLPMAVECTNTRDNTLHVSVPGAATAPSSDTSLDIDADIVPAPAQPLPVLAPLMLPATTVLPSDCTPTLHTDNANNTYVPTPSTGGMSSNRGRRKLTSGRVVIRSSIGATALNSPTTISTHPTTADHITTTSRAPTNITTVLVFTPQQDARIVEAVRIAARFNMPVPWAALDTALCFSMGTCSARWEGYLKFVS